jgi:hypothetical protein
MSNVTIKIDLDEVNLLMPSSFDEDYDTPIIHERIILFEGKPIYSSTYEFAGMINFVSGEKRLNLPNVVSMRIVKVKDAPDVLGTLSYVPHFSDSEVGINEPDQFEVEVFQTEKEFETAWDLVNGSLFEELNVSASIKAPKNDISGYESTIDIRDSDTWKLNSFTLNCRLKRI